MVGAELDITSNDLTVLMNAVSQAQRALKGAVQNAAGSQADSGAGAASSTQPTSSVAMIGSTQDERAIALEIQKLQQREKAVIAHEQAHKAAGGQYAGPATYTYTLGPDKKDYISGGEVSIDVSDESTPQKTIPKMQQVRAAALAPMDPSAQDMSVAATATQKEADARQEVYAEQVEAARQAEAGQEGNSSAKASSSGASANNAGAAASAILSNAYGGASARSLAVGASVSVYA